MSKTRPDNLIFRDAEKARDAITARQKKEISDLYISWSNEIVEKAKTFEGRGNISSVIKTHQLNELKATLNETSKKTIFNLENKIKDNIYLVASETILTNNRWMEKIGLIEKGSKSINTAFSNVPDQIVKRLITGQIYEGKWNLNQRLWSSNQETLKTIYKIVAGGVAKNETTFDIANKLSRYINPSAARQWNLRDKDGRLIYPKNVEYNSQRLGRTLIQHSYQQSFVETTKNNPLISEYQWIANGSRVCDICLGLDGKRFPKNDLPLDHPMGMCSMVPVVVSDLEGKITQWLNTREGTYPELDKFYRSLRH